MKTVTGVVGRGRRSRSGRTSACARGRDAEAHRLAERAVSGFERHWTTERRSFENYNPFTGEGADTVDSQPFYSWTALFPLMWSLEQFGVTPWDGLFFGMLDGAAFSQKNRLYRGRRYDAVCDGSEMTLFWRRARRSSAPTFPHASGTLSGTITARPLRSRPTPAARFPSPASRRVSRL